MRDTGRSRIFYALFFAVAGGLLVALANPAPRIKAELRTDARAFVASFELAGNAVETCLSRV